MLNLQILFVQKCPNSQQHFFDMLDIHYSNHIIPIADTMNKRGCDGKKEGRGGGPAATAGRGKEEGRGRGGKGTKIKEQSPEWI